MREIKFRVFTKDTNKMIYANERGYFESCFLGENGFRQTTDISYLTNQGKGKCHIMQYTGLKDKFGNEIYEGDVVKGKYFEYGKENRFIGKVIYLECGFKLEGLKQYSHLYKELNTIYEVIGNIYENKELLEV